jgi:hypothetical protein
MSRAVHIDGVEYPYQIRNASVRIYFPNGKSIHVGAPTILGTTYDIFERGQYKCTSDGMVTPSLVKQYLESYLRAGNSS